MRLISAILNVCLLRNVKQIMKTSVIHQMLDAMLTKTVAIILATLVVLYLPILILFFIVAYIFINFTDAWLTYKSRSILPWIVILPQINALANSVIYFATNNQMKRYYYKLFNWSHEENDLKSPASLVLKRNVDVMDNQHLDLI